VGSNGKARLGLPVVGIFALSAGGKVDQATAADNASHIS